MSVYDNINICVYLFSASKVMDDAPINIVIIIIVDPTSCWRGPCGIIIWVISPVHVNHRIWFRIDKLQTVRLQDWTARRGINAGCHLYT